MAKWGSVPCLISNPPLTPPVSLSLSHPHITQSASPATVNWGTTNRAGQEETDELRVCYTAPAWHTKLEQQAPSQYAHKLVSYNTGKKSLKRNRLCYIYLMFLEKMGRVDTRAWSIHLADWRYRCCTVWWTVPETPTWQPLASCRSVTHCDLWY